MDVTVEIPGAGTRVLSIDGGTYGDLLREVGYSPQEASVVVDGSPVPADREIDAEQVTVLRLIAGGAQP